MNTIPKWLKGSWFKHSSIDWHVVYSNDTVAIFVVHRNSGLTDVLTIAKGNNCLYVDGFDHIYTEYGEL